MVVGLCRERFTVENEESEKVDDDDAGLNPKAVGAVLDTARIRAAAVVLNFIGFSCCLILHACVCWMCSTLYSSTVCNINVMDEVFGENVPYQTFVWLA